VGFFGGGCLTIGTMAARNNQGIIGTNSDRMCGPVQAVMQLDGGSPYRGHGGNGNLTINGMQCGKLRAYLGYNGSVSEPCCWTVWVHAGPMMDSWTWFNGTGNFTIANGAILDGTV